MTVIDIDNKLTKFYGAWDASEEFDALTVTAIVDGIDGINEYFFAKESDEERAIQTGADADFYGYLPDWCFENLDTRRQYCDVKDEIESFFD